MLQATLSDILRQLGRALICYPFFFLALVLFYPTLVNWIENVILLGTHFGVDLMHRKAEVKDIITDVINNMTDEEEEDEEAGDDSEKDEEKDNDDAA